MLDQRRLVRRYRFTGVLIMETALHIGTGRTGAVTDSPVLRDAVGRPFIPGSSLKGAFRAAVARLIPNLGLRACDPFGDDDFCVSPQNGEKNKAYLALRKYLHSRIPREGGGQDAEKAREAASRVFDNQRLLEEDISEEHLLALLEDHLCPICKLFGSPHYSARAKFDDLPVTDWQEVTEIRHGVGIDRDSETAAHGINFDLEAVPAGTTFRFGLTVDNPTDQDLGLIAVGLREMEQGMVRLGGVRSRGLGRCRLRLEPVEYLDASDLKSLAMYLNKQGTRTLAPEDLLAQAVSSLIGRGETCVQTPRE